MSNEFMIVKRDGLSEQYNKDKITNSIYRSASNVGGTNRSTAEALATIVEQQLFQKYKDSNPSVDDIQNLVERVLIKEGHAKTAKEYILFRAERDRVRDSNSHLISTIRDLTIEDAGSMDIKRENANINGNSTMGIMLRYGSEASKRFVHLNLLRPEHSKAHLDGLIHIHDLDFYALTINCIQIDLGKLFKGGFDTGHGMLREPSSIESACILAATAIQSSQNDFFGGQSIAKFDYDMALFVAKTYVKEIARILDYEDLLTSEEANQFKSECKKYIRDHNGHIMNDDGQAFITKYLVDKNIIVSKEMLTDIYDKALKYTCKATYQGCEAFIHNINTLHCLPASEKIWVYDKKYEKLQLISMHALACIYEPRRFQVISLNTEKQQYELKDIIGIVRRDNNRRLVNIKTNIGQNVRVTDNHKVYTLTYDMTIKKDYPEQIDSIISPKGFELPVINNRMDISRFTERDPKAVIYNRNRIIINEDIAELLGYYVAGGSISEDNTTIQFSVVHKSILERIKKFFCLVFGVRFAITEDDDTGMLHIVTGERIARAFARMAGKRAANKKVPNYIMLGTQEVKRRFLNACFSCSGYDFYTVSTSKKLTRQIGLLLMSLGECPYYNDPATDNVNTWYGVMRGSGSAMGSEPYNKSATKIPFENLFVVPIKEEKTGNSGDEYVYDMAVADNENFLTEDGIVVSNSRAGAQVPFSSINYGTDTSQEGRIFIKSILYALRAGLGNGETPVFPVHIFKVKDGVSGKPGDYNYDLFQLACQVSSERLFPNFVFLDAPFNLKYYVPGRPETEAAVMGCRTRVIANIHDPEQQVFTGRGNLSFTSINLPRLGILADHNVDKFFELLDNTINMVFDQLLDRFEVQAKRKCKNMPFSIGQHIYLDSESLQPEDEIREVIKHGTLTVGFIGLAECLVALIGKHHGESQEAQELGLRIVSHMRSRCDEKTLETKLNFSLIGSPAEGLSGRFLRIDRKEFGEIPGVTDREYYTNSNHVPVYYDTSISHKIDVEAPYHVLENGGHITYVEVDGDIGQNPKAFEDIIQYMKQAGIGYGSINHDGADYDPICGYSGPHLGDVCPRCGRRDGEPVPEEFLERIKNFEYKPDDEIVYKQLKKEQNSAR